MTALSTTTLALAHERFEAALPALQTNFRYWFRRKRRDRDDLLAEAAACAWKAWLGLLLKGRDPVAVGVSGIANFAARHALKGRPIANRDGAGRHKMDVQHRRAQTLGGYKVVSLDTGPAERNDYGPAAWRDWVATDRHMGPADVACFFCDYAAWLEALAPRRRRTAEMLAAGHGTLEVAKDVGVTPAAISQARTALCESWRRFQGERRSACG